MFFSEGGNFACYFILQKNVPSVKGCNLLENALSKLFEGQEHIIHVKNHFKPWGVVVWFSLSAKIVFVCRNSNNEIGKTATWNIKKVPSENTSS